MVDVSTSERNEIKLLVFAEDIVKVSEYEYQCEQSVRFNGISVLTTNDLGQAKKLLKTIELDCLIFQPIDKMKNLPFLQQEFLKAKSSIQLVPVVDKYDSELMQQLNISKNILEFQETNIFDSYTTFENALLSIARSCKRIQDTSRSEKYLSFFSLASAIEIGRTYDYKHTAQGLIIKALDSFDISAADKSSIETANLFFFHDLSKHEIAKLVEPRDLKIARIIDDFSTWTDPQGHKPQSTEALIICAINFLAFKKASDGEEAQSYIQPTPQFLKNKSIRAFDLESLNKIFSSQKPSLKLVA